MDPVLLDVVDRLRVALDLIGQLEVRVRELEDEVRDLRSVVTPLDPGPTLMAFILGIQDDK